MEPAAFLVVAVAVIVTPGQDTALTIRNTVRGGRIGGVSTAVGVSIGQAAWTTAVAAGLGTILDASGGVLALLRLVGGAYLLVLGFQSLVAALRPRAATARPTAAKVGLAPIDALRQGLVSNLSNPKMLAFFGSLLPRFADSAGGAFWLGLSFCLLTLAWLTAYAVTVASLQSFFSRARVARTVEALAGLVLIGFGLSLVL
jgi:threonine/homoserine/homoserine lactone efflux protein